MFIFLQIDSTKCKSLARLILLDSARKFTGSGAEVESSYGISAFECEENNALAYMAVTTCDDEFHKVRGSEELRGLAME